MRTSPSVKMMFCQLESFLLEFFLYVDLYAHGEPSGPLTHCLSKLAAEVNFVHPPVSQLSL